MLLRDPDVCEAREDPMRKSGLAAVALVGLLANASTSKDAGKVVEDVGERSRPPT